MSRRTKKICLLLFSISIVFISSISSRGVSTQLDFDRLILECQTEDNEVHLLRVEHYLEIVAEKSIGRFNVWYAFPPDYQYQSPILLHVFDDTSEEVLNYKIENDTCIPNKFVNFTISGINKDEHKLIHFTAWVLVKHHNFSDLPINVDFPNKSHLPSATKKWLLKTDVVQLNSRLIKYRAKLFKMEHSDLISYAKKTATFIKDHRYQMFLLQLKFNMFFSQDAVTTLLINGENVGRSHLACALLRLQNIPSRVLLVNNDQGFWTQMHYMIEYYVPDYGWVLLDTTRAKTPFNTSRQIVNRVCYPEDENNTKTDYIFKRMKGEERWIWFSNNNVKPFYVDCKQGSKSQMFSESIVWTCDLVADACFDTTRTTFHQFQKYLGIGLTGENKKYFENAVGFQNEAINRMKIGNPLEYYYNIKRANEEYNKIIV